jgi:hypothetical protein
MNIAWALAILPTLDCPSWGVAPAELNDGQLPGTITAIVTESPRTIQHICGKKTASACILTYDHKEWTIYIPYRDPYRALLKHELSHFKCGLKHPEDIK